MPGTKRDTSHSSTVLIPKLSAALKESMRYELIAVGVLLIACLGGDTVLPFLALDLVLDFPDLLFVMMADL